MASAVEEVVLTEDPSELVTFTFASGPFRTRYTSLGT